MKSENNQDQARVAPAMIANDKAIEKLEKRAQDLGLIVNASIAKAITPQSKKKAEK